MYGYINDFRYSGQVDENGNRAGYGRLQCICNEIWEGHWSDNGTICNGRMIWYGDYYIGALKDGCLHGYGTFYNKDGSIFKQGHWENGSYKGK